MILENYQTHTFTIHTKHLTDATFSVADAAEYDGDDVSSERDACDSDARDHGAALREANRLVAAAAAESVA